jgi:hypothetical protein
MEEMHITLENIKKLQHILQKVFSKGKIELRKEEPQA